MEPEDRAQEIMTEMDKRIKETEELVKQTDDLYSELKVNRGDAKRFLDSDKVPQSEKDKVMKELEQWNEEVERDVQAALDNFQAEQGGAKKSKLKVQQKPIRPLI